MLRFILLLGCLLLYPSLTTELPTSLSTTVAETNALPVAPLAKRRVLVIYSYHDTLPWQVKLRAALFAHLDALPPDQRPELFEERLEMHRITPILFNEKFLSLLEAKFDNVKLDLLITDNDQAFNYIKQYPNFLPNVKRQAITLTHGQDNEALVARISVSKAIESLLQVLPNTKRVIVIVEPSIHVESYSADVLAQLKSLHAALLAKNIQLDIWDNFSFAELYQRTQTLSKNTAILYFPVTQDRLGERQIPRDVLTQLSKLSPVPIFVYYDSLIGAGTVGGYMFSANKIGDLLARAILGLEMPKTRAEIDAATKGYYFDDVELKRWGIPDSNLPADSIILNRNKPDWHKYRWQIVSAFFALILELVLILALLHNLRLRKEATLALAHEKALLDLRVTERTAELEKSRALLQTAQRAARMGHYVTDLTTGTWTNDAQFDYLFGIDSQFTRDFTNWHRILHPDDIQRVMACFEQAVITREPFPYVEYRITRPSDGKLCWIAAWGHNFYDDEGNAISQVGMLQDITERKLVDLALRDSEQQLQLVLEGGHLGFWDWNIVTNEVERNAIWAEMLGYTLEEIQHTTQQWTDFIYPDDRAKAWQSIADTLGGVAPYHEVEYRMFHKDGSLVWVLDHASVVQRDAHGKPLRMSGTHTDISKLKSMETELRASEERFRTLFTKAPLGIAVIDSITGHIYNANQKYADIVGLTVDELQRIDWMKITHPDDIQADLDNMAVMNAGKTNGFTMEKRYIRSDGSIVWINLTVARIQIHEKGHPCHHCIIEDITERKAAEERIKQLASYDPLTHLANRHLLQEHLKHGIEVHQRTGRQMAVLMLDLDKFKAVNDHLGHLAGDELLQQVAKRIEERMRAMDLVARLGGDEFVVVIEDVSHHEYLAQIALDIIYTLSQSFTLRHSHEVTIGVSVGIAIYPQHGDTVEALMDNADTALYHAKDNGRGCFAYFSDELTQKARERIALETRLRHAIEQQELRVYFQPQIDISSGRIVGAEALIRWHDPIEGCLFPASFIRLAEETGLIISIGEWVLRETCRLGQQWLNQGLPPVTLAVNVAPYQFCRCDISALVTEILHDTGFPVEYLELEITESGLMDNHQYAMSILNNLHNQGVHLAIDDFGTGYSSLAYLKYFPIDVLKIDKTFIDDIPFLQGDMAITATIIAMAHHLGFKVLAEGVETPEQLAFLQEHGCDRYQGYLFSKPLPADDFAKLLANTQL